MASLQLTRCIIPSILVFLSFHTANAQVSGCTDPQATNYNASATVNNGSCTYAVTNLNLVTKANIATPLIDETSGLEFVDSKLWTHNDSGGNPEIYRIDSTSSTVFQTVQVANATNVDWEEMTSSSTHLFIGDFGNNNGNRQDLKIYRISKSALTTTATSVNAEVINFSFSDQTSFPSLPNNNNFDCESMIIYNDSIHLFSKNWVDSQTKHYVLPNQPGTHVAQLRESFNAGCLVTAASIQELGVIILLGYVKSGTYPVYVWMLYDFKNGLFFNGNKRRFDASTMLVHGQTEGIDFMNNAAAYISNERLVQNPVNISPKLKSFDLTPYLPVQFLLPRPVSAFSASPLNICKGQQVSFSNSSSGVISSYQWLFPDGTPSSSTLANPQVVYSTPGVYNVTLITGNAAGNDTLIKTGYITVNADPVVSFTGLNAAYAIADPPVVLTGIPAGGVFSGPGVSGNTFSPALAGVGGPYTITYIYSDANGCTGSASADVTVNSCSVPTRPGTITATGGNTKVCPGDVKTYTIPAVNNATSYTWTPPPGGVIQNGQGTISVTILFNAGFIANDSLRVTANNICGSSLHRALSIKRNNPATPGVISGPATNVCLGTGINYSVTPVAGMNYNWSLSTTGAVVSSGQGTNSADINFSSAFISGNIRVNAFNACGTSANKSLFVKATPAIPANLTGPVTVCANQQGVPYSCSPVAANNYTWKVPTGGRINDGSVTSTTASLVTTSVSVAVNFKTTAGNVQVKANNNCGSSAFNSLAVTINCREMNDEVANPTEFILIPNPATESVNLTFDVPASEAAVIKIFDLTGRVVDEFSSETAGRNSVLVDVSGFSRGYYFVQLISGNNIQNRKLIVE